MFGSQSWTHLIPSDSICPSGTGSGHDLQGDEAPKPKRPSCCDTAGANANLLQLVYGATGKISLGSDALGSSKSQTDQTYQDICIDDEEVKKTDSVSQDVQDELQFIEEVSVFLQQQDMEDVSAGCCRNAW